MRTPTAIGRIDRRILINYVADPEFAKPLIPDGYKLDLVNGKAIVGICLIRLKNIRPKFLPKFVGLTSENIAHRIAVKYKDTNGDLQSGVYIPIRHSNSFLTTTVGTKLFSGVYKPAKFQCDEQDGRYLIDANSASKDDVDEMKINIDAQISDSFSSSVFNSLEEVSDFFQCASTGFSPDSKGCEIEGVKLSTEGWKVEALQVNAVSSNFYDDRNIFPKQSIKFDNALLMRDLPITWESTS